jgi:hypothetical protein
MRCRSATEANSHFVGRGKFMANMCGLDFRISDEEGCLTFSLCPVSVEDFLISSLADYLLNLQALLEEFCQTLI